MSPLHRAPARFAALALFVLTTPSPAPGQEVDSDWSPLESFEETISVEVTNLEVWVTDRQGRPVTGLTAADFLLTEDGERVEITNFASFEARERGSWTEPAADEPHDGPVDGMTAETPGETGGGPSAAPAPPGDPDRRLHLAVFVDNWNLRPEERSRVFRDLREFLRDRLDPDDRAMVIVHDQSLALVQELTADPDELLGAIGRVERSAAAGISLAGERRSAFANIRDAHENAPPPTMDEDGDPCVTAWGEIEAHARSYAATTHNHIQRSARALATTADLLAGVPGRRILLYVGSGLPQQAGGEIFHYLTELCPHKQSEIATWPSSYDLTGLYVEVARRANAHGLTLYAVEAAVPSASDDISMPSFSGSSSQRTAGGGGRVPRGTRTTGVTYRPSATARFAAERDREGGLFYIANETGGRAILNAASFGEDFERLATELRTYYSLGFQARHGGDGRLHRVEVKLKDGVGRGYRVRHRQSYYDKPYEQRMAERIRGVAQFGTESNGMRVRVETGESTRVGTGYRVPIRLWVPLDRLTLAPTAGGDERLAGRLRVMMAVSDAAGNLGPVRQKLVPVAVGAAGPGSGREHLVEVDLDLATASHVVALGVRDELGGETTFLRHEVRLAAPVGDDGG